MFTGDNLYRSDEHYFIIEADDTLYRVEYTVGDDSSIAAINCVLSALFLLVTGILYYLHIHIIVPFGRLNDIPQELARDNLAISMPEEKSRFFGKFTWGVNLLRESIENSRKKELAMQRDKKLLLLSLSHDIKTPLSAIKLNASVLAYMMTAFFPAIPTALGNACKILWKMRSNTGCSLEVKELPQIFESFHRGNNAYRVQGNGLGLFICKRMMSLMGGEVYADIRNGCFFVTLVVKLA